MKNSDLSSVGFAVPVNGSRMGLGLQTSESSSLTPYMLYDATIAPVGLFSHILKQGK